MGWSCPRKAALCLSSLCRTWSDGLGCLSRYGVWTLTWTSINTDPTLRVIYYLVNIPSHLVSGICSPSWYQTTNQTKKYYFSLSKSKTKKTWWGQTINSLGWRRGDEILKDLFLKIICTQTIFLFLLPLNCFEMKWSLIRLDNCRIS